MGTNDPDIRTDPYHIDILSDLGRAVAGCIEIAELVAAR